MNWRMKHPRFNHGQLSVEDIRGRIVADLHHHGKNGKPSMRDFAMALLIAETPEMLEELQFVLSEDYKSPSKRKEWRKKLKATVARVTQFGS